VYLENRGKRNYNFVIYFCLAKIFLLKFKMWFRAVEIDLSVIYNVVRGSRNRPFRSRRMPMKTIVGSSNFRGINSHITNPCRNTINPYTTM
jgi:hypothetical protein